MIQRRCFYSLFGRPEARLFSCGEPDCKVCMRPSPSHQAYVESTEHGPLLAAFVLEYKRLQLDALPRTVISVLLRKSLTNSFFS